ncbi:MAG: site-2 protease family protein [Ktedonobacterales bacterium]
MNIIAAAETFVAFIIAVCVHEAAHAAMAAALGDGTPIRQGRFSLSPRRQMAFMGTLVAIILAFNIPPAGLGWGRPVELDTRRMRVGPDAGIILVAIAGPIVNLVLGIVLAIIPRFLPGYAMLGRVAGPCAGPGIVPQHGAVLQTCLSAAQPIYLLRIEQFIFALAATNILLALVNILPLYPLDGYSVVFALLPNAPAIRWRKWQPSMEIILLIIFFLIPAIFHLIGLTFLDPAYWFASLADSVAAIFAGAPYVPVYLLL